MSAKPTSCYQSGQLPPTPFLDNFRFADNPTVMRSVEGNLESGVGSPNSKVSSVCSSGCE